MINLKMNMNDAVLLRHTLLNVERSSGFFSDDGGKKSEKISQQLDKEIDKECTKEIEMKNEPITMKLQRIWRRVL